MQNINFEDEIIALADQALKSLNKSDPGYKTALAAKRSPLEYMRYAEYQALLEMFEIKPSDKVLDVSSPQWLSLILAKKYTQCEFYYINITENEVLPFKNIAETCGIKNIEYDIQDAKNLQHPDDFFNAVISMSVIEHIYPEEGGDRFAIECISNKMKTSGKLYVTLPLNDQFNIVYRNTTVYEREEKGINFYAREYSEKVLENLFQHVFEIEKKIYICERLGIGALDFYRYGPGKESIYGKALVFFVKVVSKLGIFNIKKVLSKNYIEISDKPLNRKVNVALQLRPLTSL